LAKTPQRAQRASVPALSREAPAPYRRAGAALASAKGPAMIRCTVETPTPNRSAILRTPGRPGVARAFLTRFSISSANRGRPSCLPSPWPAPSRHGLVPESLRARTQRTRPSSETSPCRPASSCRDPADAQKVNAKRVQLAEKADQVLKTAPKAMSRPLAPLIP
jgi:hypothetical protein